MNRIFVHGDIHGNPMVISNRRCPILKDTDRSDVVVFLGDFGIPWGVSAPSYKQKRLPKDRYNARWLNNKPFTSLVLLGNHDDRDAVEVMPRVEKFDGSLRQLAFGDEIYENVFIVDTTQILTINGRKCLIIPGAESHDLFVEPLSPYDPDFKETARLYRKMKQWFRVIHWTWWINEDIDLELTEEIIRDNLDTEFDLVLSHDCPASLAWSMGHTPTEGETLLNSFKRHGNFKMWYHGHMHFDGNYWEDGKIACRYNWLEEVEV